MLKIVALALLFSLVIVYLKNINAELAMIATVCAGLIIVTYSFGYLEQIISFINSIIDLSGINVGYFAIVFKITAIAFIVEFGVGTISDFGLKSLADKLQFVGKIVILFISMPIFYSVFNLLVGILK